MCIILFIYVGQLLISLCASINLINCITVYWLCGSLHLAALILLIFRNSSGWGNNTDDFYSFLPVISLISLVIITVNGFIEIFSGRHWKLLQWVGYIIIILIGWLIIIAYGFNQINNISIVIALISSLTLLVIPWKYLNLHKYEMISITIGLLFAVYHIVHLLYGISFVRCSVDGDISNSSGHSPMVMDSESNNCTSDDMKTFNMKSLESILGLVEIGILFCIYYGTMTYYLFNHNDTK